MPAVEEKTARLLTIKAGADYLGISRDLMRQAVDSGQIPAVALGQRRWVSMKVLEAFLAAK